MRDRSRDDESGVPDSSPAGEADLFTHLGEAARRLDRGDPAGAVPQLRAFLQEVETLEGAGTLAADDGEALAEAAERLIERLEQAD